MNHRIWITDGSGKPFRARRTFNIDQPVKKAVLHITGLGQYVPYMNGREITSAKLLPGWTDYRKYIEYNTFDVTDLIQEGKNVLCAELANGWDIMDNTGYTFKFPEFMPPNPNPYMPFGSALVLLYELTVTLEDNSVITLCSDENTKVHSSPTLHSNVYGSEVYDQRTDEKEWLSSTFNDNDWKQAFIAEDIPSDNLVKQIEPEIKVIEQLEGKYLTSFETDEGMVRDIYDFGRNTSALLNISAEGKSGDVIKIYPAEKLDENGDVDQVAKNWCTVDTVITITLGEEPLDYHEKFSYIAGRYIAVEHPKTCSVLTASIDAITSAWKNDGIFTSDDERINAIYRMIERTVEANMMSVHTDCPTIERFAWQEPNHLMAPAIMFMKDGRDLWKKFFADIRAAQHTAEDRFKDLAGNDFYPGDGLIPSQCPCYIPNVLPVPGMGSFYDIIPWGSTGILGVQWYYRFYNDPEVVKENYDTGMRYLKHLLSKVSEDGFINHGLGDWGNPDQFLARENVETAFLYADTTALMEFAELLGKEEDYKELQKHAEEIKANYNAKLLQKNPKTGRMCYRAFDHKDEFAVSQACEALPLYFGLVPEEYVEDVQETFIDTLKEKGCFAAGEIGLPYIIDTAREIGLNDLIHAFILKEEHPSYYAFILDGETSLGEYWEHNPRSHAHDMMGHIIEWYYRGIAGIHPKTSGFTEVEIIPYLPEGMTEFSCTYRDISVTVKEKDSRIHLTVKCSESIKYNINTTYLEHRNPVVIE